VLFTPDQVRVCPKDLPKPLEAISADASEGFPEANVTGLVEELLGTPGAFCPKLLDVSEVGHGQVSQGGVGKGAG